MTDARLFEPDKLYGVVYTDPPWHWETWSDVGRIKTPDVHYPCMTDAELKEVPVADWCLPDCAMFMWTVDAMLLRSLSVMEAWGFQFKTVGFYWVKTTRLGKYPLGQGSWTRGNPEMCLLGTRGSPKRMSRGVRKLMIAERGRHSEKPAETRERIEKLVDGPYLEMFARTRRHGWDAVGNDLDGEVNC